MFVQVMTVAGGLVLGLATVGVLFLLGMRAKSPLVLNPVIWASRRFFNPQQMKTAGKPGAYAAVIHHRGRISGRAYETPVGAVATDNGFVIALPYGTRANWLRNVLASRSAAIVHEGRTWSVDQPEVIPMETVAARFTAGDQRGFRFLRVDQCLRLRKVGPEARSAHDVVTPDREAGLAAGFDR